VRCRAESAVPVQWDGHVRLLHPKTGEFLREHLRNSAAAIESKTRTGPNELRWALCNYWRIAERPGPNIGTLCQGDASRARRTGHPPHSGSIVFRQVWHRGAGKSHLVRAIGQAAILQGHGVLYPIPAQTGLAIQNDFAELGKHYSKIVVASFSERPTGYHCAFSGVFCAWPTPASTVPLEMVIDCTA
jgi:hypothetical protein